MQWSEPWSGAEVEVNVGEGATQVQKNYGGEAGGVREGGRGRRKAGKECVCVREREGEREIGRASCRERV